MEPLKDDDGAPLARDIEFEAWVVIAALAAGALVCVAGLIFG